MAQPDAIAIILGRGGSKGLPRKNVLPIAGKPCVQWTIEAALHAASVGEVIVSSDDADLLAIARAGGVGALTRPADLAGDTATVDAAARHAVEQIERAAPANWPRGNRWCCSTPTCPRPHDLIDRTVAMLRDYEADSVQSYAPVGKFHRGGWPASTRPPAPCPWEETC